jgi:dihydroorotase
VTAEVTPQHLYFSEEIIRQMSPQDQIKFQMNPPIRSQNDADLLMAGLINGEIDYLATDHAPHSPEEKAKGISGLTGLDTYAAFVTWLLLEKKIKPETIARVCSENPGHFFNQFLSSLGTQTDHYKKWGKGMGFLEAGFSASFTILHLKKSITISDEILKTKARWSPFSGVTFPGSLHAVFLSGHQL